MDAGRLAKSKLCASHVSTWWGYRGTHPSKGTWEAHGGIGNTGRACGFVAKSTGLTGVARRPEGA